MDKLFLRQLDRSQASNRKNTVFFQEGKIVTKNTNHQMKNNKSQQMNTKGTHGTTTTTTPSPAQQNTHKQAPQKHGSTTQNCDC